MMQRRGRLSSLGKAVFPHLAKQVGRRCTIYGPSRDRRKLKIRWDGNRCRDWVFREWIEELPGGEEEQRPL